MVKKKPSKIREEWMSKLVKPCYGKVDPVTGKSWATSAHACVKCDVRIACKEEAFA